MKRIAYALLCALGAIPACDSGDFLVAEVVANGGSAASGSGNLAGGGAGTLAGTAGNAASGGAAPIGGGGAASDCTGNALFIVGSDTLTRGDSAILDRLRALGFVVSIIADTMVTADSAEGADFVFVSRSVQSPEIMASFRDLPVPLFVTEYNLYADLGMTPHGSASSGGDTLEATQLTIDDPAHPLAAGFSGTVTVLTAGKGQYGFGVPGGDATVVATLVDEPQGCAIFAYEKGSAMIDLTAPARRVGYFLDIQASTRLTAEGWTLFDAAVKWTAGTCAPP
jgi:hypothetical protein